MSKRAEERKELLSQIRHYTELGYEIGEIAVMLHRYNRTILKIIKEEQKEGKWYDPIVLKGFKEAREEREKKLKKLPAEIRRTKRQGNNGKNQSKPIRKSNGLPQKEKYAIPTPSLPQENYDELIEKQELATAELEEHNNNVEGKLLSYQHMLDSCSIVVKLHNLGYGIPRETVDSIIAIITQEPIMASREILKAVIVNEFRRENVAGASSVVDSLRKKLKNKELLDALDSFSGFLESKNSNLVGMNDVSSAIKEVFGNR